MGKRASLSSFAAVKPSVPAAVADAPPVVEKEEQRGQTLRLNIRAWAQLKSLAVEARKPSHDLLIEAVNDLFQKCGKPPIA